ncbi:MAG TPA: transporter substrate-binding domain-containing protein [Albitalea sp.]|uniref:substrate-binding periplasmic protein n=1 Tax=Piscinibacter sp. TaxID=1903157 RepID=UPI002ED66069
MKRLLLACVLGALLAPPASAATTAVHACGGANEWPPSSYYQRRDDKVTHEVAGFSPDVLGAALQGSGFEPHVALLPFARCLADARQGTDMQIVMAAFHNEKRAESFLYSDPYLALVPRAYFIAGQWPKGLGLTTLSDLASLRLCGLNGISYAHLGPAADKVYTGAADYSALVRMLQAGRCDAFVESQEVINGFRLLGVPELSGTLLASAAVPGVPPLKAHFIVSRQYPQAKPLLDAINGGLRRLQREQRLAPMLQRHQAH